MITPATLTALEDLGVSDEKLYQLQQQMMRAQAMQNTAMPGMRQAGRTVVAANPMEHIAALVSRYRGGRRAQQTGDEIDALIERTRAAKGQLQQQILQGQMMKPNPTPQSRNEEFQRRYAPPTSGIYS